jgi:hypothetical protein
MNRKSILLFGLIWIGAGLSLMSSGVIAGPSLANRNDAAVQNEVRHAKGKFEVTMTPESETRFALSKVFTGDLAGTSQATMIGDKVAVAYVALEKFEGELGGHKGSFLMLHRAYLSKAEGMRLDIVIAPDSGTGDLAGITGTLVIDIKGEDHFYDLAYSLPVK